MPTGPTHSQYIVSSESSGSRISQLSLTRAPTSRTVLVNISREQDSKVAQLSDYDFAKIGTIFVPNSSDATELYKMTGLSQQQLEGFGSLTINIFCE
jgi:glutamate synthase domain-containing protein 1